MMIEIASNILSCNGYSRIDVELPSEGCIIYLYGPSDRNKKEEYFVVVQLQVQSDASAFNLLEQKAQEWFDSISGSGKVAQFFDKNCTMLLCHQEQHISRSTILSLEEDQYNFKKNIITYTQQELESLKAYLVNNEITNIDNNVINKIINSEGGKSFLDFKDGHKNQKDHYSLILRVALKLPFVTYHPQEQQLNNLALEIERSLSLHQISIFRQLLEPDADWSDESTYLQVERIWGDLV